ncbi:MAG TPA: hypothetical protein VN442_03755 [Bryobacteraceae bacterium]|nr:hypothetical protein [Bryobacteraceae bacterium]
MDFPVGLGGVCWAPLRFATPGSTGWPRKPLRCPSCFSRDCARGVVAGRLDHWLLARGRIPYECRYCGKRFRYFAPEREETPVHTSNPDGR